VIPSERGARANLVAASAPGKLMISGEYAVLDGAVAVVAAVSRRAYARWSPRLGIDVSAGVGNVSPGQDSDSPQSALSWREAAQTRELAEEAVGAVQAELSIDATELRSRDLKLGLGSSAAAAAAAAGAVLATRGENLQDPAVQRRAFELALRGHKAVAAQGSGADVAASALGGFVRFQLAPGQPPEAQPIAWPAQVVTRVVWTGKEARTHLFVGKVRDYEASDAAGYGRIRDSLHEQALRFADAIERAAGPEIVAAAGEYGRSMGELGERAGVSIVTRELQTIADLARRHGGAAKPSGAGGGDVAIAFFTSEVDAQAFDVGCRSEALQVLDLSLGAPGVRPEPH
jgi:phosphomevalonate kinase